MSQEHQAGHYDPERKIIVIGHPTAFATAMAVGFNPPPMLESVIPIVNTVEKFDSLIIDVPKFFHDHTYNKNPRERQKKRAKRKSKQQRQSRKNNRR
jgi:hypothetical protein